MEDPRQSLRALLEEAGDVALDRFGRIAGQRKRDNTLVTEADSLAEVVLVSGLRRLYPNDAIVGEEGARVRGGGRTWYIDPIDGTSSYLEGLSYWGPTIGLADGQGPLIGAFWLPRIREFWYGERGRGAWRSGRRLAPLTDRLPGPDAVVYVPSRFHQWGWIDFPGKCRNLGSLAAHVTMVAAGGAVAALVPPGWKPWDVAGAFCLLEEVGGVARTWNGKPVGLQTSSEEAFLVGSPAAVDYLLAPGRLRPR
jgi:fructose-1,6-bisphosphatase/inositol monophosphatase family enzyme